MLVLLLMRIASFILLALLAVGCSTPDQSETHASEVNIPLLFADGFALIDHDTYSEIRLNDPWNKGKVYHTYFLGSSDQLAHLTTQPGTTLVETPVKKIALSGSPYLGFLIDLKLRESIVGVDRYDLVYDRQLKAQCKADEILQFGEADRINYEVMADLSPDLFITSGFPQSEEKLKKLKQLGIPIVFMLEWQEQHPLGRAEWIKVLGLLTGTYKTAEDHFHKVVEAYKGLAIRDIEDSTKHMMCGHVWEGVWYTPGGANYLTKLVLDAGFNYAWTDTDETGSVPLSLEAVLDKQLGADVWINPGKVASLNQLKDVDDRYADFNAFQQGKVFSNDKRSDGMANDFWESGAANPHLVLNDLVLMQRDTIPDSSLYYFKRIPIRNE